MSSVLTSKQIVEGALQLIGNMGPHDTAADADSLARGNFWLDMILAHLAGTAECFWLVPAERALVPLVANVVPTDIVAASGLAASTLQYVRSVTIGKTDSTVEDPVEFIDRDDYDLRSSKPATGTPNCVFIDRSRYTPQAFTYPVIGLNGYELRIAYQTFEATLDSPIDQMKFEATWNLWAVTELGAKLGSGPIVRLPGQEIQQHRGEAARLLDELQRFYSSRHMPVPPVTAYRDF